MTLDEYFEHGAWSEADGFWRVAGKLVILDEERVLGNEKVAFNVRGWKLVLEMPELGVGVIAATNPDKSLFHCVDLKAWEKMGKPRSQKKIS